MSLLTVACASLLQLVYESYFGSGTPFILLYPAILISAWYGGLWPGMMAVAVGVGVGLLFFIQPHVSSPNRLMRIGTFLTTSALAAGLSESLHRARRQAAQSAEELQTELKRRAEIEQVSTHLASIVESSVDAIIGTSLDRVIRSWNTSAERLLGYTAEQAIGQNISLIIPAERAEEEKGIVARLRAGERAESFDTLRLRSDGQLIDVSLTISPIKDESGRVIGASKIMRDITDKKRAEARIYELMAELKEADRRKDEFLAMLGHELRNPLSGVSNAVASASLDESHRPRALEIARRQADQLARLIDDLLDVARITQGRIPLRQENVDLAQVIARAVESAHFFIEARGVHLTVAPVPKPLRVRADPARLEQVLVNLLSNAAKYTDAGGRIDIVAEGRGAEAVIRIRDTGIGITPEMLPRIWDLFAQAERSLDRTQGGLGIGLTVASRLIELQGGRIEAYSEGVGKGAELVVKLPLLTMPSEQVPEAGLQAAPAVTPVEKQPERHARFLVVEDNIDAAETLMMLLELLGHEVRVVHDGLEVVAAARAFVPDVMLVDIGLPGIDGYEVARRLRREPGLEHVVLVALTGYGRAEDKQQAMEAGFAHHLVKPVNPDTLGGLVAHLPKHDPARAQSQTTATS